MKYSLKVVLIFFLLFGFSSANENIRFVDINYIVNNSTSGKKLNQVIESKNKKIISELNDLGKKLKEKKDKIIKQKNILKKEELDKMVKNYEIEVKKFDEIRKKKRDNFNNFSINSKKKIIDLLNPLITDYLQKESIQLLLQKDKIIFGDDKLDITKEILKIFNEKHSKISFE